jgi:hypothetical protein
MEKGAAGCPSLPLHYGLTNPGISRDLASRPPTELGLIRLSDRTRHFPWANA